LLTAARYDRAKLNVQNAELWNAVSTMLVMLIDNACVAIDNQSASSSFLKLETQITHCGWCAEEAR
jgi:hypothetical protein